MPYSPPRQAPAATAAAVTDGGAVETVVLTLNGVSSPGAGAIVQLDGMLELTTAASGTTAVAIKCRRGTTASGTQVGTTVTAKVSTATAIAIPLSYQDSPGELANASYVITITETNGSADGTMDYGYLTATIS